MEMQKVQSKRLQEFTSCSPGYGLSWRRLLLLMLLNFFPLVAYSALFPPGSYTYPPTRTYYAVTASNPVNYFNFPYPDFASAGQAIADAYIPPPIPQGTATKKEGWSIALGTSACNQGNAEPLAGGEYFSVAILGYYQIPDGRVSCSRGGLVIVKSSCPYGGVLIVGAPYYLGICVRPNANTITLTGGNEVEPSTPSTIKNLPIIATVINQSTGQPPTTPVTVKVSIKVEDPKSGGHDHGDSTRPRGGIADVEKCLSDDVCKEWTLPANNGVVKFNFKAPEASGKYTITATCDGCTNTATKPVAVRVDGLEPIPNIPLFYALTESNGDVIGAKTGWHTDNHNLTHAAAQKLMVIAVNYRFNPKFYLRDSVTNAISFPPGLHLNDASLPWGGVYDICARPGACAETGVVSWQKPHAEHRRGTVIDVRANGENGSIHAANKETFKKYLKNIKLSFLHESEGTSNEHIHVRLMGRKE
jgi:hypothetical protein